jgi:hypothetical protein
VVPEVDGRSEAVDLAKLSSLAEIMDCFFGMADGEGEVGSLSGVGVPHLCS